jgi:hypothetical protein
VFHLVFLFVGTAFIGHTDEVGVKGLSEIIHSFENETPHF